MWFVVAEQRRLLARRQVQQAMDLKDQKQLEAAIARYKDTGVSDSDPVLVKAGKMLQVLKAKAGELLHDEYQEI